MIEVNVKFASVRDFDAWGGARDILQSVEDSALDFIDNAVNDVLGYGPIDETTLNDFIWFDIPAMLEEQGYII